MIAAPCLRFPYGTRYLVPWLLPFFTALCIFTGDAHHSRSSASGPSGAFRAIASVFHPGGERIAGNRPRALKLMRAHGVSAAHPSRQKVSSDEYTAFETADLPSSDIRSSLFRNLNGGRVGVPDVPRDRIGRSRPADEDDANAAARKALRSSYVVARPPPVIGDAS